MVPGQCAEYCAASGCPDNPIPTEYNRATNAIIIGYQLFINLIMFNLLIVNIQLTPKFSLSSKYSFTSCYLIGICLTAEETRVHHVNARAVSCLEYFLKDYIGELFYQIALNFRSVQLEKKK